MKLHAIVNLLNDNLGAQVMRLCNELQQEFRACGIYVTAFPHISYHIAESYDIAHVTSTLADLALEIPPFTIYTTGLGLFTGEDPILYVPIIRSPLLSQIQLMLWERVDPLALQSVPNFHPERWVPHITLAYGDLNETNLPAIMKSLSKRTFNWEIHVDNLALIYKIGEEQGLHSQYPLAGSGG
jgi:2'-5' RNA ligase